MCDFKSFQEGKITEESALGIDILDQWILSNTKFTPYIRKKKTYPGRRTSPCRSCPDFCFQFFGFSLPSELSLSLLPVPCTTSYLTQQQPACLLTFYTSQSGLRKIGKYQSIFQMGFCCLIGRRGCRIHRCCRPQSCCCCCCCCNWKNVAGRIHFRMWLIASL